MKIVKGVAIYTLLILGALAVFAMLLVGCMFMFPNFDVFGWKVIFKSNEKALTYGAKSASYAVDSGEYYTINIDAGMHSVYIHQWANQGILESEIDYVYVEKIDEMIDRFGNMPKEIENLIEIARIKILCKKMNISKVQGKRNFVVFIFEPGEINIDINELVRKYKNRIKFTQGIKPQITLALQNTLALNNASEIKMLHEVKEFLCI